ncbi:MAG: prolipoprotein diacylglyceryl transferase [Candidatus Cloacimonetes bacterium]|nr:prolipoprotein diacylglyceryl transferase [Candidatus Cloacimonadota bacterium]
MLPFPNFSPTIIKLGMFEIRWYALLYIISFIVGHIFLKKFYKKSNINLSKDQYENWMFQLMLGVIIGGRVGYLLFYNLKYYIYNPLKVFAVWEGGMSFHGGALGVIIFAYFFCRKHKLNFFKMADPAMSLVAVGLGLGRLGNFINAELYGRITNVKWAIIFPNSDGEPRHPSQIYEFLLEGVVLFFLCFFLYQKKLKDGIVFWAFIASYGIFRFLIEFTREPDAHLGFVLGNFTQGQILSFTMVIVGLIGLLFSATKKNFEITNN